MSSVRHLTVIVDSPATSSTWFGDLFKKAKNLYAHLRPGNSDHLHSDFYDVEKGNSPKSIYIEVKKENVTFNKYG